MKTIKLTIALALFICASIVQANHIDCYFYSGTGSQAKLLTTAKFYFDSTMALKPPQNIRLPSKGIASGLHIFFVRLSLMTFFQARSR